MSDVIDLGLRRELFVDRFLVERMDGLRLLLHHPERREVAFTCDAPWEDNVAGFASVFEDGGVVRLYYRAAIPDLKDEDFTIAAMAESLDGGRSFRRPELGLVEFNGSRRNNILHIGKEPGIPPAFIDTNPARKPDERYKGFCAKWQKLFAMCSSDGLRWRPMTDGPLQMPGTFDTINSGFWDSVQKLYRSYTRFFADMGDAPPHPDTQEPQPRNVRAIQSSTSLDFIRWSTPVPNSYDDNEDRMQLYTNSALPCPGAEHIYIAFPNRFVQHRRTRDDWPYPGCNDALFMTSRDGVHWHRNLEAWIRPGNDERNWTDRNNYPTWGIVKTSDREWSMYVSEHYRQPDAPCLLRRLSIRPFGYKSAHADFATGRLVTPPLTFSGQILRLNYSTSAIGYVRVGLERLDGQPVPGRSLQDMTPRYGDELDGVIAWKTGADLSSVVSKPVRLVFELKDADIFALRFSLD